MANQLILPPQKFNYKEITDQFPSTGNPKKKVFFQAELRSLANGDAKFGIVAYVSWKEKNEWVVSPQPVTGTDNGEPISIPFKPPLAFANNEVVVSAKLYKKKKKKASKKGVWNQFEKMLSKLYDNKKQLNKATLLFTTSISKNPHLEYNVILDVNGTVLTVPTKPCPPASPEP